MQSPGATKPTVTRSTALLLGGVAVCAGLLLPWLLPSRREEPPTAVAARGEPVVPDTKALDAGGSLVRLYAATLAVLGLGVGGIWLYRRRLATWAPPAAGDQIEVLGAVRLDARCHVVLVRARGGKLLAGIDGGGLKLLVPVPPQAADDPALLPQRPPVI